MTVKGDEFIIRREVMRLIRELARRLSALKKFVGYVMAEAVIERGDFQSSLNVLSDRKNLAVIDIADEEMRLNVTLLKPKKTEGAAEKFLTEAPRGTVWKIFSTEEVAEFIAAVDDDNAIHRGARPIVPGFLIIETLFNAPQLIEHKKIRLRFKHFTTVDEKLYLTIDGKQFHVDARERKVEGWILDS
ncbi:MAG: hypothetical protein IJ668_09490 [Selenomonadaceae bacterium]|nr:hypothetical protein [Selenomonadaceae bacterium]